jgi:hypothetical protein
MHTPVDTAHPHVPRRPARSPVALRRLVVALLVFAASAAVVPGAEAGPRKRLTFTKRPPATTSETTAVFRFRTHGARARCRLDTGRLRRCRSPLRLRGLRPGAHRLVVRARHRAIRARWTVTQSQRPGAAPGPGTPQDLTQLTPPAITDTPPGRTLVFEDTFDGSTLKSAWRPYSSAGHSGNGLRRPSAISLDGSGNLVVTAQMADGQIVSGGMSHDRDQRYGYYEFRVRAEADPTGTMSAVVLTWPQSGGPAGGQNDIYETGHAAGTRRPFHTFIHYGSSAQQKYYAHDVDGSEWHTLGMDWSADAIKIYRDGALVWTLTDTAVIPDVAHHLCIQLDAFSSGPLTQPVRMYVDYVRIYQ